MQAAGVLSKGNLLIKKAFSATLRGNTHKILMTKKSRPSSRRRKANAKHRHFVAGPMLALMIGVSILSGGFETSAQSPELSASVMRLSEGEVLSLGGGMQAISYSGEGFDLSADTPVFHGGSALIAGNGFVRLQIREWEVSGFHGAFHLSSNGDSFTVAALTTPALIRKGSHIMIVPSGMQWRSDAENALPLLPAGFALWTEGRTVSLLPERFFARQLQNLAFLANEDTSAFLPEVRTIEPWPLWTKFPSLRIGTAQEEATEEWNEEVLGYFRYLLEQGDAEKADAFMHNELYADLLSTSSVRTKLASIFPRLEKEGAARLLLLGYLMEKEDFWLISSLHPSFREETWGLFGPDLSREAMALRLFMLPQSLRAPEPVSTFVLQRWAYEAEHFVTGNATSTFVHTLVQHFLPFVSYFEEQGYPERSRKLARALSQIVENTEVSLPADIHASIKEALSFSRVSLEDPPPAPALEKVTEPVAEVVEVVEEKPEVASYTPDVVERRTYSVLRDIGALFLVDTAIDAVEPNTARVTNIVIPTSTGDQKFNFHYNVATGQIERVIVGNKEYPYSLSIEAFRDWVRA